MAFSSRAISWGLALALPWGCSGPTDDASTGVFGTMGAETATAGATTSTGTQSTGGATGAGSTSGTSTTSSTSGGTNGPGVIFDVGSPDMGGTAGDGPGTDEPCTKVDLLFVIDNSGSMQNEQAALVASFPGFVAGMRAELADVLGYNVGITTTDVFEAHLPPLCEIMGTLVTSTDDAGGDSSQMDCGPYVSGRRYMTEEDDLATKFACAATVGTRGNPTERPVEALLAALSPDLTAPGGCNEGFLRRDALLVVVVITDERDKTDGDPAQWFTDLVAIKSGIETNIVMLSVIVNAASTMTCASGVADKIESMTNMFTNGFVGDICSPPFDMFFTQAISVIENACDGFTPPG